jgi:hypothetical protein
MSRNRLRGAFNPPLAAAVVAFWLLASGIVIFGATRGLLVILALLPAFLLLAAGTWRRWRWALAADLVLLGSQLIGAAGAAYELAARGGGDKGAQLRAMGVDPFFGVLLNLAVSLLGTTLFGWALARLRAPTL